MELSYFSLLERVHAPVGYHYSCSHFLSILRCSRYSASEHGESYRIIRTFFHILMQKDEGAYYTRVQKNRIKPG